MPGGTKSVIRNYTNNKLLIVGLNDILLLSSIKGLLYCVLTKCLYVEVNILVIKWLQISNLKEIQKMHELHVSKFMCLPRPLKSKF